MKGFNDPMELEETETAIKQTSLGKTPGTDGISASFTNYLKLNFPPF